MLNFPLQQNFLLCFSWFAPSLYCLSNTQLYWSKVSRWSHKPPLAETREENRIPVWHLTRLFVCEVPLCSTQAIWEWVIFGAGGTAYGLISPVCQGYATLMWFCGFCVTCLCSRYTDSAACSERARVRPTQPFIVKHRQIPRISACHYSIWEMETSNFSVVRLAFS